MTEEAEATFLPILTVKDDEVSIDFVASYNSTWVGDGEAYDDPTGAAERLDAILGEGTSVEKLRRLADHIEAQEAR